VRYTIPRHEWAGIEAAAAAHYARVKDWRISNGNYAPSETGIRVGLAGEWALKTWLDSLPVAHDDDPTEWGWDRVTRGAVIEVKARQVAHDRTWPWRVNQHTVEDTIPRRRTSRPGKVIVWAATYGSPDVRIHEVELLGWVTHDEILRAPKVYEAVGNTGASIWNYCAPPESIRPMQPLGARLVEYDRGAA
jgi:hypothetical protein